MGLLHRVKAAASAFRNDVTEGITIDQLRDMLGGGQPTDAGVDVSPETAMRYSAVYACVRVLAETTGQMPFPIYRRTADGRETARSHPLFDVLNYQPNRWQTAIEFREMMTAFVVLRGNAYAYIGRDLLSGAVTRLVPLRPGSVRARQLPDLSIEYDYAPASGVSRTFKQSDIFHLRGLCSDGVEGMSPIGAFRSAVGLAVAAEKQQAKSFGRGVKFPGLLKTSKALTPAAVKNLRESFNDMHSGENAYKTPVLEEGMDWINVGMNSTDAQTIETRQFQRGEIASIFRVPLHMINGDVEASKGWSTLEQLNSEFIAYSLMPWFVRWEQAIRRDLFTPAERATYYAKHNVDSLLRGDTAARYGAYNVAINSGWMSRNEVRDKEEMNRVDGLDEFLQPLNMSKAVDDEKKRQAEQQNARK